MGMSASQARFLSLTGALHDIEFKAQNIESQKLALATQKDGLFQDYCAALDATKIQVAYQNGAGVKYVDANYGSVCGFNENRCRQYALKDNQSGFIIVPQDVKDNYQEFSNDKYSFAWAMLGFEKNFGWNDHGGYSQANSIGLNLNEDSYNWGSEAYLEGATNGNALYMTEAELEAFKNIKAAYPDSDIQAKFDAIEKAEDDKSKQEALQAFRDELYSYGAEVFAMMNLDKSGDKDGAKEESFPDLEWSDIQNEFNYYVNLWTAINEAGGCKTVEEGNINGEEGTKWFKSMVESGRATIMEFNTNSMKKCWEETSVSTSTNNSYLQSIQDDTNLEEAKAKYEHELDIINRKDTRFDTELSKLETQRTAITTELDAIKKVKDDNIERTFGIFS